MNTENNKQQSDENENSFSKNQLNRGYGYQTLEPTQPFHASYVLSDGNLCYVKIQYMPEDKGYHVVFEDELAEALPVIPESVQMTEEELEAYLDKIDNAVSSDEDDNNSTEKADFVVDYNINEWCERGFGKTERSEAVGRIIEQAFS